MNETTVTVVGNIATDMSTKRVGSDEHLLVGFRVASSARRWDRATETWTDGDRFSAWVSCWRKLGEGVVTSLVKGDPVVVTGRLSVREYEMNGERRFSTEIAATSVGPDLSRSSAKVVRRRAPGTDEGSATDSAAGAAEDTGESTAERSAETAGDAARPLVTAVSAPAEEAAAEGTGVVLVDDASISEGASAGRRRARADVLTATG